jgi:hypothetical protein
VKWVSCNGTTSSEATDLRLLTQERHWETNT